MNCILCGDGAELKRLRAENARLREAHSGLVKAWEALGEGRYSAIDVERWLCNSMSPAINRIRALTETEAS